jgi:hypothetical protein
VFIGSLLKEGDESDANCKKLSGDDDLQGIHTEKKARAGIPLEPAKEWKNENTKEPICKVA